MSVQTNLKITPEQAEEMPMVDLAFMVLKVTNSPMYYRDLMQEIAKIKGISDEQVMQVIAQLYTEINIDGRFACVGNNMWGLKRWYPIDKAEDPMSGAERPRIINDDNDDDDDDLDDELFEEDADEDFSEEKDEDDEDYDSEDDEEMFDDEDAEEVDEEIDDEDMMDDEEAEDDDFDNEDGEYDEDEGEDDGDGTKK